MIDPKETEGKTATIREPMRDETIALEITCEIGTKDHSEHDRLIMELRHELELTHITPRSLVAKIKAQEKEIEKLKNRPLQKKLDQAYARIEEHLQKHKRGEYVQRKV